MKLRGAIFDVDGTLLDSMPIWDTIGERYLTAKGLEPRLGLSKLLKSMSMKQAARHFAQDYGAPGSEEEIVAEINAMIADFYQNHAPFKDGVRDFLDMLRARGVRMAVATATDRPLIEAALRRLEVLDYFDGIFTCTEVGAAKTRPDIYDRALEHIGTDKADTVVFEDALYATRTACAAGYRVVGLFDESAAADETQMRELCDQYLHRFADWRE